MTLFSITVHSKSGHKPLTYICDNYSFDGNMLFLTVGQDETYVIPRENILFYSVTKMQAEPKGNRTWNGQKIAEQGPVENILLNQQSPTVSREVEE